MAKPQGQITIERDRCKGCQLCIEACPVTILVIDTGVLNAKGYQPATIKDMKRCLGCGYCALVCPDVAISVKRRDQ